MTKEEAITWIEDTQALLGDELNDDLRIEALNMAISALKDIKKIQTIIDNYFTYGKKSGYECMGEIDSILEPYKKGE